MANTLKLEVVTPEAVALSEDVEMVTLPGIEGEMGIYPQHIPLLTQLVPGIVVARKGDQFITLAVSEGFVEITGNRVSLLTDLAVNADADEAEAEAARQRAEARLRERSGSEQTAAVEAAVAQSLAMLKGRKRR
ncbi:MAG: ATP synthase F1 subunit epsilon [Verrucomicrobia bacterium]|nr:ATP synthase F1 subunit epsilon [Verrucomicrobiota bacterium]